MFVNFNTCDDALMFQEPCTRGCTALHLAAIVGGEEATRHLLQLGANRDALTQVSPPQASCLSRQLS